MVADVGEKILTTEDVFKGRTKLSSAQHPPRVELGIVWLWVGVNTLSAAADGARHIRYAYFAKPCPPVNLSGLLRGTPPDTA